MRSSTEPSGSVLAVRASWILHHHCHLTVPTAVMRPPRVSLSPCAHDAPRFQIPHPHLSGFKLEAQSLINPRSGGFYEVTPLCNPLKNPETTDLGGFRVTLHGTYFGAAPTTRPRTHHVIYVFMNKDKYVCV